MRDQHTMDVELYVIDEGSIDKLLEDDGVNPISMELTCEIEPYVPEQAPTYACGGQPAEGGSAEAIELHIIGPDKKRRSVSGLLFFLPHGLIERWEEQAYADFEQVGPPEPEYERDEL